MRIKAFASIAAFCLCLFVGFWAFAYQGYTEDAGSEPVDSWPYGAALYLVAGAIALVMIRRRWPELSGFRLLGVSVAVVTVLVIAAMGSLDAGGNSFEF